MPMPTTYDAIVARLLEIGDDLAFECKKYVDTPDTLEWYDLREQLKAEKAKKEEEPWLQTR